MTSLHCRRLTQASRSGWRTLVCIFLAGVAAATAGCGSSSTSLSVDSSLPTLTSLAVTPASASVGVGASGQFTATGTYSDGSQHNLTQNVTWSSSNTAVATISNDTTANGVATGVSVGTASIGAAFDGFKSTATLTVTPRSLVSIVVTPPNASVAKGTQQPYAATGIYSDKTTQDLTAQVVWSSSVPAVAPISAGGVATGTTTGMTTIAAGLGNLSGSTTLTVASAALVSIAVTPANSSLTVGATQAFVATGTYTDGTMQIISNAVTWTSSAPAVATISTAGVASGVAAGATTIAASLGGITGSTGLTVTVTTATLVSLAVTPATASIRNRTTQQFVATGTYSDGSTQDLTVMVNWNSSLTSVATIGNTVGTKGLATADGVGMTTISAAFGTTFLATAALTVTAAPPPYAYVADTNGNNSATPGFVSQYTISAANGSLQPMATPSVPAGNEAFSITVDSSGKFVYVANYASGGNNSPSISQYSIGMDGALTAIGTPLATDLGPNGITAAPAAPFVYVANFDASVVDQYSIGTTGLLTQIGTAALPAGSTPASVTIGASGLTAYVTDFGSGTISQYSVNAATGILAPLTVPSVAAGTNPIALVTDSTGHFAFAVDRASASATGTLLQYTISAVDGSLSPNGTVAAGAQPFALALDTQNKYLYVANSNDPNPTPGGDSIWQYAVDAATGVLTLQNQVQLPAGSRASAIVIDPTNNYLYVADRGADSISQYSIGALGVLTLAATVAEPAGSAPSSIALSH